MTWEKRSKESYYYRKVRTGGKVRSIYAGKSILSYKLYADVEERRLQHLIQKAEIEAEEGFEREIEKSHRAVMALADAVMLLNNYHLHKGRWRRVRG